MELSESQMTLIYTVLGFGVGFSIAKIEKAIKILRSHRKKERERENE